MRERGTWSNGHSPGHEVILRGRQVNVPFLAYALMITYRATEHLGAMADEEVLGLEGHGRTLFANSE